MNKTKAPCIRDIIEDFKRDEDTEVFKYFWYNR